MPLTLSCADLGSPCTQAYVSGETVEELLQAMYAHAIEHHGRTMEQMTRPENRTLFMSAIKQSARPPSARTLKIDV
jgi:predicted small metal-binding protein